MVGNETHQQILGAIRDYYAQDERIIQILVFGSLGRGNWDAHSDLDLDIIVTDDAAVNIRTELAQLCQHIKTTHGLDAIIVPKTDEGDVVLSNLVEFSVRYHPLHDTKPAILDSMRSVAGALSLDEIHAAVNHDHVTQLKKPAAIVNTYIRHTLELHTAIMRGRVWMATDMIHRLRSALIQLYAVTHGEIRAIHYFDTDASAQLQARLATLTSAAELADIKPTFNTAIDLLEQHIGAFSHSRYQLSAAQQSIIDQLKQLPLYQMQSIAQNGV